MAGPLLTIEQVMNLLVQTPSRVDALTDSTTPAPSRTRPDPDEWSANEVLAHLRACADVWGGCISAILAEYHPTLRAVNPTTWIKATDYLEMKFTLFSGRLRAARRATCRPGTVAGGGVVAFGHGAGGRTRP